MAVSLKLWNAEECIGILIGSETPVKNAKLVGEVGGFYNIESKLKLCWAWQTTLLSTI